MKFDLKIHLDSYICNPYTAAHSKVIEVLKKSGSSRARSEDKRHSALISYLKANELTLEQFQQWQQEATSKWVFDKQGEIVIPAYQFLATLTAACHAAPAAVGLPVNQVRALIRSTDLKTGRKKCDSKFERFIRAETSNEPRLTIDEVLDHVDGTGQIVFDPDTIKVKKVADLITWALTNCGVGSVRKMGYGRGKLISLTESTEPSLV